MEEKKEITAELKSLFTDKETEKLTAEEITEYNSAFVFVDKWLNSLVMGKKKRRSNYKQERAILDGFIDNNFELNEKGCLVYHLIDPLQSTEGDIVLDKLTFKQRLSVGDIERGTEGVNPENGTAMITAYISMLTGTSKSVIKQMNAVDFSNIGNICVYFL